VETIKSRKLWNYVKNLRSFSASEKLEFANEVDNHASAPSAFFAASVFLMNTNKRILLRRKNLAIVTDYR
jgi:predicted deacetylase